MNSRSLATRSDHKKNSPIAEAQIVAKEKDSPRLFKIIYIITATLLIGLPLLMGAKDETSEALVKLISFSLILSILASHSKNILLQTVENFRSFALPTAALFLLFTLQITPLPLSVLSFLASDTAKLHSTFTTSSGRISLAPYDTISDSIWLLALLALLLVTASGIQSFKIFSSRINNISATLSFNPFAALFIFGATICTAIALAHWASGTESYFGIFGEDRTAQTRRAHWPFVNPNHLSIYLQIGFVFCFAAFLDQCSSIKQRLNARLYRRRHATGREVRGDVIFAFTFGLISFFLAVGNLLTASRMGNVLLLIGGGLLLWFHFKSDKELGLVTVLPLVNQPLNNKTRKIVVAIAILIFLGALIAVTGQSGQQLAKERIAYGLTTSFDDVRLILITASAKIIAALPISGTGLGAWHIAAQMQVPNELAGFKLDYAHNDPLQFIAETGLLGLMLLAILTTKLLTAFKTRWALLVSTEEKRGFFACLVALLLPTTHSLVDFPFHVPALAVGITFLLAALLSEKQERPSCSLDKVTTF